MLRKVVDFLLRRAIAPRMLHHISVKLRRPGLLRPNDHRRRQMPNPMRRQSQRPSANPSPDQTALPSLKRRMPLQPPQRTSKRLLVANVGKFDFVRHSNVRTSHKSKPTRKRGRAFEPLLTDRASKSTTPSAQTPAAACQAAPATAARSHCASGSRDSPKDRASPRSPSWSALRSSTG